MVNQNPFHVDVDRASSGVRSARVSVLPLWMKDAAASVPNPVEIQHCRGALLLVVLLSSARWRPGDDCLVAEAVASAKVGNHGPATSEWSPSGYSTPAARKGEAALIARRCSGTDRRVVARAHAARAAPFGGAVLASGVSSGSAYSRLRTPP